MALGDIFCKCKNPVSHIIPTDIGFIQECQLCGFPINVKTTTMNDKKYLSEVEQAAYNYATQKNSGWSNDYYGFIEGAKWAMNKVNNFNSIPPQTCYEEPEGQNPKIKCMKEGCMTCDLKVGGTGECSCQLRHYAK